MQHQGELFPTPKPRAARGGQRGRAAAASARATAFEAGSTSRRAYGWHAPTVSPNQAVLGNLALLRDRSRQAVRNDGHAKGVIDRLVTNIIGTGIKPLSLAADRAFANELHRLWLAWTMESDADGLLSWYGQQQQAVRCWLEAGEAFARLRPRRPEDGLRVPLQVQILEPELCPYTHNATAPNGNRIRAGIEFDAIGRRVAYYFHPQRPGDLDDFDAGQLRRIPADQVIHVYKPVRAGQLRGLPYLLPALVRLRELDKFDDATLLRQQLSAMFVAFLRHTGDASENLVAITGQEGEATSDGRPALGLEPGLFQELAPGEEVDFSQPPGVVDGFADFMRYQLRAVAAATGVPYEILTGDMNGLSDRTLRVILHEFRRQIQAEQHETVAFQLCRPVWRAFLDSVYLSAALPIPATYLVEDPEAWCAVKWMPQGWPYLHPVQDVDAAEKAIRAGFTSRSDVVSEQGEDSEVIDAQQAADNARADRLGLKYESDGRQAKAAAPAPPNTAGKPGSGGDERGGDEKPPADDDAGQEENA